MDKRRRPAALLASEAAAAHQRLCDEAGTLSEPLRQPQQEGRLLQRAWAAGSAVQPPGASAHASSPAVPPRTSFSARPGALQAARGLEVWARSGDRSAGPPVSVATPLVRPPWRMHPCPALPSLSCPRVQAPHGREDWQDCAALAEPAPPPSRRPAKVGGIAHAPRLCAWHQLSYSLRLPCRVPAWPSPPPRCSPAVVNLVSSDSDTAASPARRPPPSSAPAPPPSVFSPVVVLAPVSTAAAVAFVETPAQVGPQLLSAHTGSAPTTHANFVHSLAPVRLEAAASARDPDL